MADPRPRATSMLRAAARRARRLVSGEPAPDPTSMYGPGYFGVGRDAAGRGGLSGYERYDRDMSNADFAAYVIWHNFDVRKTLEVGAALGYLVEALRDLEIDAYGLDISEYAVEHA